MSLEEELTELSNVYHGTREYVEELERGMADCNKKIEKLREALQQQRKYERENWPFVDEKNEPIGTGESITYHLASLYCWSPEYVLSLPHAQMKERLYEIWESFSIAGDIIKRYEIATEAFDNPKQPPKESLEGTSGL